ncbi:MAG: beta-propeller fold lactonase family protein, partial [Acidobacteriota bacterium]
EIAASTEGLAVSPDGSILLHADGLGKTLRSFLRQSDTGALTAADSLDTLSDQTTQRAGEIQLLSPTENRAYVLVENRPFPDSIGLERSLAVVRFSGAGQLTRERSTLLAGDFDLETPGFAVDSASGDVAYSLFEGNGVTGSATLLTPVDGGTRLETVDSIFGGTQLGLGLPKVLAFGPTGEQLYVSSFGGQPLAVLEVSQEPRGFGERLPFQEIYRPRELLQVPGGPLAVLLPRGALLAEAGDEGHLELGSLIPTGRFEQKSITASPDGLFLYISSSFDESTEIYRRTDAGGLEEAHPFTFLPAPLTISPDGAFFIYPDFEGELLVATRDSATGLAQQETSTGVFVQAPEIRSLEFAPDGRSLYLIEDFQFPNVPSRSRLFSFDPSSRSLAEAPSLEAFAQSEAAVFSPDSRFLYTLSRGAGGGLRLLTLERSGSSYELRTHLELSDRPPTGLPRLAIDPEGRFFYAADGSGRLHAYRREPATGELADAQVFEQGEDGVDWLEDRNGVEALSLETGPGLLYVASAQASTLTTLSWGCRETETQQCLSSGRFEVSATWETAESQGTAFAEPLTDDSGYLWFFGPDNVEVVVKVLDACEAFDRFWVFAAGLTDVGVTLRVEDRLTGAVKSYVNDRGTLFRPVLDTSAFATCSTPTSASAPRPKRAEATEAEEQVPAKAPCEPSPTSTCLAQGRFRVELSYLTSDSISGAGTAVRLTEDTGYFWFFGPDNIEVVIKVLDACEAFGRFWVFAGGLTNVRVEITVTDTETGEQRTYLNPLGSSFEPIADTEAFSCS